jgi:nitrous oxide reductase accessory protein NosL
MSPFVRKLAFASATTLALLACRSEDRTTQVTVAITSETEIPKELDTLEVVVIDADGSESSRVLHDVQNPRFFPRHAPSRAP